MKKVYKAIGITIMAAVLVAIGFAIGYRATILNGSIEIDKANPNIGYYTVFGQTDVYNID